MADSLGLYALKERLEVTVGLERKQALESVLHKTTFESIVDIHGARYKQQQG